MAGSVAIKDVAIDINGVHVVIEIDDGAGLTMPSSLSFAYDKFKDVTTWDEFKTTVLYPEILPLIEKFKKIKAVGTILTSKMNQPITI